MTVTVPIYALNQVSEERCDWLVPGMLETKVMALVKCLHQRPRSRLMPLAEFVAEFVELNPFAQGPLLETLLKAVRERTQLAVQRNDFKLDMVAPHLFMNFRVVDEHGRQLGTGRNLAALKAELGGQALSAFQALAALKTGGAPAAPAAAVTAAGARGQAGGQGQAEGGEAEGGAEHGVSRGLWPDAHIRRCFCDRPMTIAGVLSWFAPGDGQKKRARRPATGGVCGMRLT